MHPDKYKKRNTYRSNPDGSAALTIIRRDGSEHVYVFDAADLSTVNRHLWRVLFDGSGTRPYAATSRGYDTTQLHRLIDQTPEDREIIFLDGDPHNCRRSNLKRGTRHDVASHMNRATCPKSGWQGVAWEGSRRLWVAYSQPASRGDGRRGQGTGRVGAGAG